MRHNVNRNGMRSAEIGYMLIVSLVLNRRDELDVIEINSNQRIPVKRKQVAMN